MQKSNENALILRAQHGETDAFSPLVRKYHPRVYTHIHRRVKDPETAKDLTQETWLKAFRSIKSFRANAAFSSWKPYRIAENVCIDYFRKLKHNTDPPSQRFEICRHSLSFLKVKTCLDPLVHHAACFRNSSAIRV